MLRQPSSVVIAVPSAGEKPGAAAIAIITSASARVSTGPWYRSRAIARASTEAARAPSAWMARPAIKTGSDGASAQIRLPTTKIARPPTTKGARPAASAIGPTIS